jgi:hypothetical protein
MTDVLIKTINPLACLHTEKQHPEKQIEVYSIFYSTSFTPK